jgi:Uma2 family endonuclease
MAKSSNFLKFFLKESYPCYKSNRNSKPLKNIYAFDDDSSDKCYELFNGELIEMPPESGLNVQIANRLFLTFLP